MLQDEADRAPGEDSGGGKNCKLIRGYMHKLYSEDRSRPGVSRCGASAQPYPQADRLCETTGRFGARWVNP